MSRIATTLVASIAIAAVSTLGDFVWATWLPQHMMVYGLTHGTLLFCTIGLALGAIAGRPSAGAASGAVVGAAAAGLFYLTAPILGSSTMFVVWFSTWIALALLYARLSGSQAPARVVLSRGVIAATASGLAFYSISGIWRPFDPQGWDYAVHFGAWTLAYVPGFAALLLAHR